jgi:hypothetical protein
MHLLGIALVIYVILRDIHRFVTYIKEDSDE